MKQTPKHKIKEPRIIVAAKRLAKIEKIIAPYVITRKVKRVSTAGKWREESNAPCDF